MAAIDIALIVFLIGALMLGVYRGAVRQLAAFGAWLVTFLLAAQLRSPLADWLQGQMPQLSRPYVEMVAFLLAFVLLFGIALTAIQIGGKDIKLSSRPIVDDLIGGLLMAGVALLAFGSIVIILDSYYATNPGPSENVLGPVDALRDAFEQSAIVDAMRDSLVPGLRAILGPLLPADVRAGG